MFAYPNLQTLGMGTLGGMSMQSTMHQQMHHQQTNTLAPPVPLPRYECVFYSSFYNFGTLFVNIDFFPEDWDSVHVRMVCEPWIILAQVRKKIVRTCWEGTFRCHVQNRGVMAV